MFIFYIFAVTFTGKPFNRCHLINCFVVCLRLANFKPKVKIECSHDYIVVAIAQSSLPNVDRQDIQLRDSSCSPTFNGTHLVIIIRPLYSCGTIIKHYSNSIIYKNQIRNRSYHRPSPITREKTVRLAFLCSYSNQGWVGIAYNPDNKPLTSHNWYKGTGNFTFLAKIYPTKEYFNAFPPSAYPLPFKLNQRIYLELGVLTSDTNLRLLAQNCLATPTMNISDSLNYWIIRNG